VASESLLLVHHKTTSGGSSRKDRKRRRQPSPPILESLLPWEVSDPRARNERDHDEKISIEIPLTQINIQYCFILVDLSARLQTEISNNNTLLIPCAGLRYVFRDRRDSSSRRNIFQKQMAGKRTALIIGHRTGVSGFDGIYWAWA